MTFGSILTRWTIRVALLGLAAVLVARCSRRITAANDSQWRWIWTASWLAFVLHVAAAFEFHHHWSHSHAIEETARRTEKLLGWRFGEGLYFSYCFLLLWGIDVAWWWFRGTTYSQSAWRAAAIQGYLAFIAFNGTVVFESGWIRYGGLIATMLLLAATALGWSRRVRHEVGLFSEQATPP